MKKKIAIIIGIAVCIMLLASPALASAGYSMIYGNANEDDTIDMRDTTYIKLAIFGKKPKTDLADANYDGKISMLDIGQTKLIILGKEKKLTLVDMADRTVTVPRPIERVVSLSADAAKIVIALGECDKLMGIGLCGGTINCVCYHFSGGKYGKLEAKKCMAEVCGGRLPELPEVSRDNPEFIVSLKPDVILASSSNVDFLQEQTGIPAVTAYNYAPGPSLENPRRATETLGIVLEKEKEAEELISFIEEKIDKVEGVTSQIPKEEKPEVYLASRGASATRFTTTHPFYDPLDIAGGINVAKDAEGQWNWGRQVEMTVSKEQIIAWNPDIILDACGSPPTPENNVECVLSDPDLQSINAVKNENVYYSISAYCCGMPVDRNLANVIYLAKLLHPEEFPDLDVEEEGNEIYERFLGVDGLFSEYADNSVWLREWLDSQK